MLLDPAAASAFITGYKQVLLRVAGDGENGGSGSVLEVLAHARHRIKQNPTILEQAVVEVQNGDQPVDEEVLRAIRTLRVDDWVYLRDTRSYSIFMQRSAEFALGVLALTERLRDIVGGVWRPD